MCHSIKCEILDLTSPKCAQFVDDPSKNYYMYINNNGCCVQSLAEQDMKIFIATTGAHADIPYDIRYQPLSTC